MRNCEAINTNIPAISSDGRYIALVIDSSLDSKDTNSNTDIFRLDRQTGELIRASATPTGAAPNVYSFGTSISGDGRYVAFHSYSTNINDIPTGGLFERDLQTETTIRIASPLSNNDPELNDFNKSFTISENGEYIAFISSESNLVPNDTNGVADVFVKNLQTGNVERISISTNGEQSNRGCDQFASLDISADGRYIAFSSEATNLVDNDTNGVADVFVCDRPKSHHHPFCNIRRS